MPQPAVVGNDALCESFCTACTQKPQKMWSCRDTITCLLLAELRLKRCRCGCWTAHQSLQSSAPPVPADPRKHCLQEADQSLLDQSLLLLPRLSLLISIFIGGSGQAQQATGCRHHTQSLSGLPIAALNTLLLLIRYSVCQLLLP